MTNIKLPTVKSTSFILADRFYTTEDDIDGETDAEGEQESYNSDYSEDEPMEDVSYDDDIMWKKIWNLETVLLNFKRG